MGGEWKLRAHNREDYLTTSVPVVFDPGAVCPRFEQFLQESFQGDEDAEENGKWWRN